MRGLLKSALIVAGCSLAFNAFAETAVDEVWTCKLKEGQEIADVHAANAEWVKHVNGALDVGEVKSATVEPIVGTQGQFFFVDSYPSRAAWATVDEYQDSDAGKAAMKAIDDRFNELFDCSANELFKFTPN